MERINGSPIRLERITDEELNNLKEYVIVKFNEVMEDLNLVNNELSRRNQPELPNLYDTVQDSVDNKQPKAA